MPEFIFSKSFLYLFDLFIRFLTPLVAAFMGAFIAYRLARRKEEDRLKKDRIEAGQKALFTLIRQLNAAMVVKKSIFEKFENERFRHYIIPSTVCNNYDDLKIDFKSITYLLMTDHGNILNEALVVEDLFHSTIKAINRRSDIHIEFQKLLDGANILNANELKEEDVKKVVGLRICITLEKSTNEIYDLLKELIEKLMIIIPKLAYNFEKLYPGTKFIRVALLDSSNGSEFFEKPNWPI